MKHLALNLLIFLLILGTGRRSDAGYIEEAVFTRHEKIGIFIGTFDPLHEAHMAVVTSALQSGAVNRIIVLPNNSFAFRKADASPYVDRLKFLQIAYAESREVLVPRTLIPPSLPIGLVTLRKVAKQCPTCKFIGLAGSDLIGRPFQRHLDRILLPQIESWIFAERKVGSSGEVINAVRTDQPIAGVETSNREVSSTILRKWFAERPQFRQTPNAAGPSELLPEITKYISQNGMYRVDLKRSEHPIFGVSSFRADDVEWRSGQILGLSSRAGQTPFFVQVGTNSPIDHIAIISVEGKNRFAYEFTNSAGVTKTPLQVVLDRARGKSGHLMAIVAELENPISDSEWKEMRNEMNRWISLQNELAPSGVPDGPKSCSQFVQSSFAVVKRALGKSGTIHEFNLKAYGGFSGRNWKGILHDSGAFIPPISFFEKDIRILQSNLPKNLYWGNEDILRVWKDDGDLSKLARTLAIKEGRPLTANEIPKATQDLLSSLLEADQQDRRGFCHGLLRKFRPH